MRIEKYGKGGFDPSKENNNIIEVIELPDEEINDSRIPATKEEIKELAKTLRSEMNGKIDRIADIIQGASGQEWANDKNKIADDIRKSNRP